MHIIFLRSDAATILFFFFAVRFSAAFEGGVYFVDARTELGIHAGDTDRHGRRW